MSGAGGPRRGEGAPRAVVIGAGVAGLATAGLLARDGYAVTVLERNAVVGGRAGSWEASTEAGTWRFDTGPSWYLMPEVFEHFAALMGADLHEHLRLETLDPAYRVFAEGYDGPLEVRSGREESAALFESVEPGAGRRLVAYLDSARETYEMAREHFLSTTFSRVPAATVRAVLPRLPLLVRLLTESLHSRVARTVRDRRLRQVLGYPAVFLAATPRTAPSMYHLMSHLDLADGVRYPQGGFAALVEVIARLAAEAGAEIRTGVEVTGIETASGPGGRARVTGVRTATGELVPADVVVSCADLHHTETRLLPEHLQTYGERYWARRQSGPGVVLALLGVRGRLPELTHHNLFFTADWDANFDAVFGEQPVVPDPASTYVCMPSATDDSVAPAGHENLFVLVPVSPDAAGGTSVGAGGVDGAGDPAAEEAVDRAIAQISQWAGVPDLAERVVVRRSIGPADFTADYHAWRGNALGPAHTLWQSAFLRGRNVSRHVEGLLYAGATTAPGVGLPMCLISAENVVKRLRGDHSAGPLDPTTWLAAGGSEQGADGRNDSGGGA
ncbi:phytoene desaturase [Kytococcus aerolatus]|uniref:Phytoene desaturase n=1 Tax=Kytococcus aerolatus TaxID=592308 RepID=A0A212T289_9MICO|nr:phytoene desaturase family protein [Kytococcus aerolatus]SNC59874.1 phytoene desaturase [Kytococcus aerolatus]